MTTVSVVLPSLLNTDPSQARRLFLEQAVSSIRAQTAAKQVTFQIVVGIDAGAGAKVPPGLAERLGITFVESRGRSVTAALNAAARRCNGDYIGFLEDDDQWAPVFVETALAALQEADFVLSTELEVTGQREVIRTVDFATASTWLMKRQTWQTVGEFDESDRIYHDNEWLGRLGDSDCRRVACHSRDRRSGAAVARLGAALWRPFGAPAAPWLALAAGAAPCPPVLGHATG